MKRKSQIDQEEINNIKEDMDTVLVKVNKYKEILSDFDDIVDKIKNELYDIEYGAKWVMENVDGWEQHQIEKNVEDVINAENNLMKLANEISVMMGELIRIDEEETFGIK